MRFVLRVALITSSLLVTLSCGDPVGLSGDVAIGSTSEAVLVKNTHDELSLYSFIIDEDQAALVDWIPCVRDDCGMIRPGDTRRVTAAALGSGRGQVVLVYWWRGVYGVADEYGPGPVSVQRVVLGAGFPFS